MKYRPKHILEYILLKVTVGFLNILPYRIALINACSIAWFFHYIIGWRKELARSRIREVFGDRVSEKEVQKIAWVAMRNLGFNLVETSRASRINERWIEKHMDFGDGLEFLKQETKKQPVILALAHMGNWDLAGIAIEKLGVKGFFIMRKQKNPLTTKFINDQRTAMGSEVLERDDPALIKKTIRGLKAGKTMAILLDLRAKTGYFEASWLGHKAHLAAGIGVITHLSKAKVLSCKVVRKGWGQHELRILGEHVLDPDIEKTAAAEKLTQEVLNTLSPLILKHPEQYFWYNKRWVLDKKD